MVIKKFEPCAERIVYWHSDPCFSDLFPWSFPYKIQPDEHHKSHAMSALDVISDVLGGRVDLIKFMVIRSIGNKLKIGLSGQGFDIYNARCNDDMSVTLRSVLSKIEQQSVVAGQDDDGEQSKSLGRPDSEKVAEIISNASLSALEGLYATADVDSQKRLQKLFEKVFKEAEPKKLASVPSDSGFLIDLARDFPNFSAFCDYLRAQFALSRMGDSVFRLPPILLVGEPGIGKTEILRRIAEKIKTDFKPISMSTAQSGSTLAGSDIFWSNSRQGLLFDQLIFGQSANPIIMLDELDKSSDRPDNSPVGALYELLERKTASQFIDRALPGVEINASHVVWVATCNDEFAIESALLTRFRVFRIPQPTRDQAAAVVRSIFSDMVQNESWGAAFDRDITDNVIKVLAGLSPRDIRMTIESACANAAIEGRNTLLIEDVNQNQKRSKMGFHR